MTKEIEKNVHIEHSQSNENKGQPPHHSMDKIVALCKRRGFIYPGSEIYGGLANTWDYGPYGVELKNNVKKIWWDTFVRGRDDMVGLDSAILMHPEVWKASGHVENFSDPLVDCKKCKARHRGDKLLEGLMAEAEVAKLSLTEISKKLKELKVVCPDCKKVDWTEPRQFNLMFKTHQGVIEETAAMIYLRPETAQGIFVNFKNVRDSTRVKIPFGIGQIGKAFRNEITPGNFTFRTREFEQMEIEYFVKPGEEAEAFDMWKRLSKEWYLKLGVTENHLRFRDHEKEELSHYSTATCDVEYLFPFGKAPAFGELQGIAIRTDFDLKRHAQFSKQDLMYRDPVSNEKFVPYVIEPSWGCDRTVLMFLCEAYHEEEVAVAGEKGNGNEVQTKDGGTARTDVRVVMKFHPLLAPVKVAVFPLHKKLETIAREIYEDLKSTGHNIEYDDSGSIGKRYRRQDEIGTPLCITVDFDTTGEGDKPDPKLKGTVTVRDRDTMEQRRVKITDLKSLLIK